MRSTKLDVKRLAGLERVEYLNVRVKNSSEMGFPIPYRTEALRNYRVTKKHYAVLARNGISC